MGEPDPTPSTSTLPGRTERERFIAWRIGRLAADVMNRAEGKRPGDTSSAGAPRWA